MLNFLLETFRLGLKNLRLHKLRSLLTALGIIIGVAAFIAMAAIGEGTKQAALKQVEQLGATNILVRTVKPSEANDSSSRANREISYGLRRLTDLAQLGRLSGIAAVVPLRDTEQPVVRGAIRANANAIGTTPQLFDVIHLKTERGRTFTEMDYNSASPVCVLGAAAARQLFPYQDPLGERIYVGTSLSMIRPLEVVGVLEPTGLRAEGAAMINRNLDQDIYYPLTLAQQDYKDLVVRVESGSQERKRIELTEVWLQAQRAEDVEQLAGICENLLSQSHPKHDYEVKAPIQILRNAEHTQRMFNFVMVGIASLSLIVGGIGIMNIMLAAVTERTREIGIRRALGAKRRHITLQFLIETTVISLTGGLIGVALGCSIALLLPPAVRLFTQQDYPTQLAAWAVIGSFIISGTIGITFGLYPAMKAARMNPIDALRHE